GARPGPRRSGPAGARSPPPSAPPPPAARTAPPAVTSSSVAFATPARVVGSVQPRARSSSNASPSRTPALNSNSRPTGNSTIAHICHIFGPRPADITTTVCTAPTTPPTPPSRPPPPPPHRRRPPPDGTAAGRGHRHPPPASSPVAPLTLAIAANVGSQVWTSKSCATSRGVVNSDRGEYGNARHSPKTRK